MTQRLTECLNALQTNKKKGLVTFTMAGDPDQEQSSYILNNLPNYGADIVELGMPFSDPLADGPMIQDAATHALKKQTTPDHLLTIIASFRKAHPKVPLIVMGYANIIRKRGEEKCAKDFAQAGVDGVITSDLPPEEEYRWRKALEVYDIALIRMIAPTTHDERMKMILPQQKGFIYYVSVAGTTGTSKATPDSVQHALKKIRSHVDIPVAVGFGIQTPQDVCAVAPFADLVVVGSALCRMVAQERRDVLDKTSFAAMFHHVSRLKEALIL